ncbi:MAG: M28 family peptidase, partial [Acidobacteria bacterium]|nr:M28 family peptidase [Acidobacteriota bacterium]
GAPAGDFSARRALEPLRQIARQPHPAGSAEHRRVGDYILSELEGLGVEAEVQETIVSREFLGLLRFARVRNILGRIPGRDGQRAVLVAAHYDSVSTGPGAGDNGSAVAAMLESIRALGNGPPPANDLLFLFSDAEELGLLGIQAFVDESPYLGRIGATLNFDALGTAGPILMFETGEGNTPLIEALQEAAPAPLAYSFARDFRRLIQNDTDFSLLEEAGVPGLNFAILYGSARYHSSADRVEYLQPGSLQHQGSTIVALLSYLGDLDLTRLEPGRDSIYFNLSSSMLLRYSQNLAPLLALLGLAVAGMVVFLRPPTGRIAFRSLLAGGSLLVLGTLIAYLTGLLLRWLVLLPVAMPMAFHRSHLSLFQAGACLIAVGLVLLLFHRALRGAGGEMDPSRLEGLAGGGLLTWSLVSVAVGFYLPASSYLLSWAVLGAGLALAIWRRSKGSPGTGLALALAVVSAPAVLLWLPALRLTSVAFGLAGIPLLAAVVASLLGLEALPAGLMLRAWGSRLPVLLLLLGISTMVAGFSLAGFDAAHPRPNSLFYALDSQSGEAFWGSFDEGTDAWTSQFFPDASTTSLADFFGAAGLEGLRGKAPAVEVGASKVERTRDEETGGGRLVTLRVVPAPQAEGLRLLVEAEGGIRSVSVDGVPGRSLVGLKAEDAPKRLSFRLYAPPREGFELAIEVLGNAPIEFQIIDQSMGLPDLGRLGLRERPADMTPNPSWLSDGILVRAAYEF